MRATVFFTTAILCAANAFAAHPAHSSISEVEWNADSGCFEVAMRLHISDLEDAISVQDKSRFRLKDDEKSATRIEQYLAKTFAVESSLGKASRWNWIGMQLELHEVWVYFEVKPVGSKPDASAKKDGKVNEWDDLFKPEPAKPATAKAPLSPTDIVIRHAALMEVQPEQTNIVTVRTPGKLASVVLNVKTSRTNVVFDDRKPGWSRRQR